MRWNLEVAQIEEETEVFIMVAIFSTLMYSIWDT